MISDVNLVNCRGSREETEFDATSPSSVECERVDKISSPLYSRMSSSTEFESTSDPVSSSPGLLVVEGGGGSFEHPLTAATTAMLNINGASDESPGGGFNVFYDIYGKNLQGGGGELLKSDHRGGDIWS